MQAQELVLLGQRHHWLEEWVQAGLHKLALPCPLRHHCLEEGGQVEQESVEPSQAEELAFPCPYLLSLLVAVAEEFPGQWLEEVVWEAVEELVDQVAPP